MRVSTSSTYLVTAQSLGSALERVQKQQTAVGTMKAITAWSDDTPAAASAERYRAEEADLASFQRTGADAKSWLSAADGTLQSMSGIMARIKELGVSAASGALTGSSRTAIADEVDQLRAELKDLGNTQHLGRSLFGGFASQALATDSAGAVTATGDSGAVRRQVSPTITLTVNVGVSDLMGFDAPPGQDVFSQLSALATAVRTGDAAGIASSQAVLGERHSGILRGLATVGTTTNRVDAAAGAGSVALEDLAARRSQLEDVDYADAILKLNQAQAGYTAALGAASKANLPSLADFLR